jgi:hypothetical protein
VDLRPGVAVIPATQAIHPSNSSKVTSTSISVSTSTRGSFLSSSSTVRTPNLEEISTSVRTTRQLVFLPQQPTRMAKQPHHKQEVVHASTVENKITRRRIAPRKQLSSHQQSMPRQDKEHHNKHQESVVRPTTVER